MLDLAEWRSSDKTHTRPLTRVSESGDRSQNIRPSCGKKKEANFRQFSNQTQTAPLRRALKGEERTTCLVSGAGSDLVVQHQPGKLKETRGTAGRRLACNLHWPNVFLGAAQVRR